MTAPNEVMPFNFDPTAIQVALGKFEKGRSQFEIVSAKSYIRAKKDGGGNPTGENVIGIYYALKCVSPGPLEGQRQIYNAMVHTEGALGFSKSFLMAALGFNPRDVNAEKAFDSQFAGLSWSLDPKSGGVGDMWAKAKGHVISLEHDVTIDTNSQEQQKFSNPQPVTA